MRAEQVEPSGCDDTKCRHSLSEGLKFWTECEPEVKNFGMGGERYGNSRFGTATAVNESKDCSDQTLSPQALTERC